MKPMSASPAPLKPTNRTIKPSSELHEEIRRRAYELYEQRGRTDVISLKRVTLITDQGPVVKQTQEARLSS